MTSILKADTIQDTDGNNIINESGNTITIGASGDTTNIIGTLQNNGAAVGGDNTPMASAYLSADQTISHETWTKVQLNTEFFDTDSAYDNSSNYRFTVPSGEAGKYFIYFQMCAYGNNNDERNMASSIYKNGTSLIQNFGQTASIRTSYSTQKTKPVSGIFDLAVSDYIEFYAKVNVNSGTPSIDGTGATSMRTYFAISKMIG